MPLVKRGGGSYTLPTASDAVLGGVKVGAPVTVTEGVLGVSAATTSAAGLVELATEAEVQTGTDTTRVVTPAALKAYTEWRPSGFKNLLINGAFFVNQRGYVSGAATSGANEYTIDRWRVVTSGQELSFADSNGTRTVTAPAGGIEQVVEGTWLQSGTYTISWTGTATCTVNGTARTNGESFSLTGGSNVTVKFINGTVANAQLEFGGCATPFERRPDGLELALCQQYYQILLNLYHYRVISYSENILYFQIFFPQMRAAPTVTIAEEPDVYVYSTTSLPKTGFVFTTSSARVSSALLKATKTSHGLTDGFLSTRVDRAITLSAEL